MNTENIWSPLPYEEWKETLDTLHMCMQIPGKVKLKLCPFLNQWWEVAFYVTASGMTTGLIPYNNRVFEINFDFINHNVVIRTVGNETKTIPLVPRSVAEFYRDFMGALKSLGIEVSINTLPSEVPNPIHCDVDTEHCYYDNRYVEAFRRILVHLCPLFEKFRSPFRGKSSPVHFFWGSFDLSHARFSGKPAKPPGDDIIMRYSENEENFACGFWAGNPIYPNPALYSYIYPAPKGIESVRINPGFAFYDSKQRIFILPYEEARRSSSPEKLMLDFLQSTYNESAKLAGWDVKSLEGPVPGKT